MPIRHLLRLRSRLRHRVKWNRLLATARAAGDAASRGKGSPTGILMVERLGDIVAGSATIAAMRERGELNGSVVWFGKRTYRDAALRIPGVSHFVEIDCYGELSPLADELASEGWNLIDLNLNGKSCACCGGTWHNRAGTKVPDVDDYYHHGALTNAFALAAGLPTSDAAPRLRDNDLPPLPDQLVGKRFVVLHPESEETARNWNAAGWTALIDRILATTDLHVVLVGLGKADAQGSDRIHDLRGATGLTTVFRIVHDCALFIGIDSSLAHIANAYRRPGLILLGRYRRFLSYMPYTGYFAEGGALIVRYASECPFLPAELGARALRTVLHRLEHTERGQDPQVGAGGPWDVGLNDGERLAECGGPDGHDVTQDGARDLALLLWTDSRQIGAIAEFLEEDRANTDARNGIVLAVSARGFAQLAEQTGNVHTVIDEIERAGCRFVIRDCTDEHHGLFATAVQSYRYLRCAGRPVQIDAAGMTICIDPHDPNVIVSRGPDLHSVDRHAPDRCLDPRATCWLQGDLRGRSGVDLRNELLRLLRRGESERGPAGGLPESGDVLQPIEPSAYGHIDRVQRTPDGDVVQLDGWYCLGSTGTPPSLLCFAEDLGPQGLRAREVVSFPRLERPDVAHALSKPAALFSGLTMSVPEELRGVGSRLAVLALDRRRGGWQRIDLP